MAHLVESVRIQQDPAKLNNLGGVLGHIDAVFIASGGDVDDDVAVDLEGGALLSSHGCGREEQGGSVCVSSSAAELVGELKRVGDAAIRRCRLADKKRFR